LLSSSALDAAWSKRLRMELLQALRIYRRTLDASDTRPVDDAWKRRSNRGAFDVRSRDLVECRTVRGSVI
jgi:hypothetical protein